MFTYSINIARHSATHGRTIHFGKLELSAGISEADAMADFAICCERFTAADGFSLTLRKHPTESYTQIAFSEGA